MKKNVVSVAAFLLMLPIVSTLFVANNGSLRGSDVSLANINAIAAGEAGDTIPCWSYFEDQQNSKAVNCETCTELDGKRPFGADRTCLSI